MSTALSRRTVLLALAHLLSACGRAGPIVLPTHALPPVGGLSMPGLRERELVGRVSLLNVFATWCPPCRAEHPVLVSLSRTRRDVRFVGLSADRSAEDLVDDIRREGNPFEALSMLDFGYSRALPIRGVPTTFLVGRDGVVVETFGGPISMGRFQAEVLPALRKALAPVKAASA